METHTVAAAVYSVIGLVAVGLLLGGLSGDTSDTGNGVGMAVFGALLLSAAVSGLLGVLAGSSAHVGWAVVGLVMPGWSLPFFLYYGLKGWDGRNRG